MEKKEDDDYDYLITFDNVMEPEKESAKKKWNEIRKKRGHMLYRLSKAGLSLFPKYSLDKKYLYILICCEEKRLEKQAEADNFELKMLVSKKREGREESRGKWEI